MTAHPRHPQRLTATEVNRVVLFTARDAIVASPDTLTLLKRQVNEYDLLEVSDHSAWEDAVALVNEDWRHMFHPSRFDRLRFRYMVYGWQKSVLLTIIANLEDSLFSPSNVSAISSWFRLASTNTVITGSGYSSVYDELNPSNPAVQATDALRPPSGGTSANGFPIISATAHVLTVPVSAANNGTAAWGFWFWGRLTNGAGFPVPVSARTAGGGTSVNKIDVQRNGANDAFVIFNPAAPTTSRILSPGVIWTLNNWVLMTVEFDGTAAAEADTMIVSKNGVIVEGTFSGTSAGPLDLLTSPTGVFKMIAQNTAAGNPWTGDWGPNWGFMSSKMPGSRGLLTDAARLALYNFERPT